MSGLSNPVRPVTDDDAGDTDPRNFFLDQLRETLRAAKRFDLEAQARMIFAGVFPPPEAPKGPEPDEDADDGLPEDVLELQMLVDACKTGEKFKFNGRTHNARLRILAAAQAKLERELKALKVVARAAA